MLQDPPFGTTELVFLLLGVKSVAEDLDPADFTNGLDYYCIRKPAEGGGFVYVGRELGGMVEVADPAPNTTIVNQVLGQVRFPGWLLSQLLLDKIFSDETPTLTLEHGPETTLDVLEQELYPHMPGETAHVRKLTMPSDDVRFSFKSSLLIAKSRFLQPNGVYHAVSLGIRRQTKYHTPGLEDQALVMDMEFLIPLFAFKEDLDAAKSVVDIPSPLNRIQLGMGFRRLGAAGLGNPDAVAVRLNASTPFESGKDGASKLGKPVILVQQQTEAQPDWTVLKTSRLKKDLKALFELDDVQAILDSPLGPFTPQQADRNELGLWETLSKFGKSLGKVKNDFADLAEEFGDAWDDIKAIWDSGSPNREGSESDPKLDPNTGLRHLGPFLKSLGLVKGKSAAYKPGDIKTLDFWSLFLELMKEVDGFPLYVYSFKQPEPSDPSGPVDEEEPDPYDDFEILEDSDEEPLIDRRYEDDESNEIVLIDPDESSEEESTDSEADPSADNSHSQLGKKVYATAGSLQLALVDRLDNPGIKRIGVRGMAFDIPLIHGHVVPKGVKKPDPEPELLLQIGKFLSGETLMDNWIRRLMPSGMTARTAMPGVALFFLETALAQNEADGVDLTMTPRFRIDLGSLGFDFQGANKAGLINTPRFGLGGVEVRFLLNLDVAAKDQIQFATGGTVKLKNLKLNLAPEEKSTPSSIQDMLLAFLPFGGLMGGEKDEKPELDTRLTAKTKSNFSFSLGYLFDSERGGIGAFDLQLYDAKGKAGGTIWIPVERRLGPLFLKNLGLAVSGMNALNADKELKEDKASITVLATGGIQLSAFELGLIGAGFKFPLHAFEPEFQLEGLDLSFKAGSLTMSGGLIKRDDSFAGHVRIQLPSLSIAAMGSYGKIQDPDDEEKEHISLFIYGAFSAVGGGGINILGVITITGIAAGFGVNRKLVVPRVNEVAQFPLIKIVMGEGSAYDPDDPDDKRTPDPDDPRSTLSKPADVNKMLEKMDKAIKPEIGANFGAIGLRFSLVSTIDCFALAVVQLSSDLSDFELNLLGLARMSLPQLSYENGDDRALCFLELQIAAALVPSEGVLRVEAVISNSSWVFRKDCRITGGFALFIWFDGDHAGDVVVSLGGYHPRFIRPAHYPVVPRLGLHWVVSPELSVKGGVYAAFTPSCFMAGGKLEAHYKAKNLTAWFAAYVDLLVAWNPVYFELAIGISIRVDINFLRTWSITLAVGFEIWGPPFGALISVDIPLIPFTIEVGEPRDQGARLFGSWAKFGRNYIDAVEGVEGGEVIAANGEEEAATGKWAQATAAAPHVPGPNLIKPELTRGSLVEQESPDQDLWVVRADDLEIGIETTVPATRLEFGAVDTSTLAPVEQTGQNLTTHKPLKINPAKTVAGVRVGVRPMTRKLSSHLRLTVVRDDEQPVGLSVDQWSLSERRVNLPGALWDPDENAGKEPDAKMIENCLTGVVGLQPPVGECRGELGVDAATVPWTEMPARAVGRAKAAPTAKAVPAASFAQSGRAAGKSTSKPGGWGASWQSWQKTRSH